MANIAHAATRTILDIDRFIARSPARAVFDFALECMGRGLSF
jgi:hypothetical protein